ncbi:MAG TPA: hypothetical protein VF329_05665 [Gammaproteobacteria bacterium]
MKRPSRRDIGLELVERALWERCRELRNRLESGNSVCVEDRAAGLRRLEPAPAPRNPYVIWPPVPGTCPDPFDAPARRRAVFESLNALASLLQDLDCRERGVPRADRLS